MGRWQLGRVGDHWDRGQSGWVGGNWDRVGKWQSGQVAVATGSV